MATEVLILEYDGAAATSSIVFSDRNYGRVFELIAVSTITRIQVKLGINVGLGDVAPANLRLDLRDTPIADGVPPTLIETSTIVNPGLTAHPIYGWVEFPFDQTLAIGIYSIFAVGYAIFPWGNPRYRIQAQPHPGIPANARLWVWRGDVPELLETNDWTRSIRVYGYIVNATPTVTTNPATSIGAESAILNGSLVADGGEACVCGFEYGLTPAYGSVTGTQSKTTGQTFSQFISGLIPNTLYHFRAFATNALGTSNGADVTFTTLPSGAPNPGDPVDVMTLPATHITESSARLNGVVAGDGGRAGLVRFQWGLTTAYGMDTSWLGGYREGDEFSADLPSLAEGTAYHFRAQFKHSGIFSGQDISFSTGVPEGPVTFVSEEILRLLEAV